MTKWQKHLTKCHVDMTKCHVVTEVEDEVIGVSR